MGKREKVTLEPSLYKLFFFFSLFPHPVFLRYMYNCYIGEPMECEMKMENLGSPEREAGGEKDACADGADGMADCDVLKGGDDTEDSKKRKRKPYRPGWLLLVSKKPHLHRCKISTKYLLIFYSSMVLGIGGFMVRQRKCHTRQKKEFFAQLAGETTLDGQPIERTIDEGQ